MDNGLIFPYRFCCAHAEAGDAKQTILCTPFGACVGECVTRSGSRQAMG
jgi:hypothetical protein